MPAEWLELFLQDLPAKEIAARMGVSVTTVSTLKLRAMRKLQIRTDFRLILFAIRHGLVKDRPDERSSTWDGKVA